MATFDNQADDFLRPLFIDYRRDTMDRLRPAGALAARRGYQRWRASRLAAVGVAVVAAVVLLAAGGGYLIFHRSGQPLPVTGSPTPQSVPPTTSSGSPTAAPATAPTQAATGGPSHGQLPGTSAPSTPHSQPGTPQCHSSGLSVGRQAVEGAMGQVYTTIALTNTSGRPCELTGRPTIQAVDAAGKVMPATVGDNGPGGVRVVLRAGQSGYFLLRTTQPDIVGGGPPCQPPADALLVTPPGEAANLRLPGRLALCNASVTAVQTTPPGS